MPFSRRFYRALLKLYLARFREEYQSQMERQFLDDHRNASGAGARPRFWARSIWDLALTFPGQLISELTNELMHGLRAYRKRSFSMALAVIALAIAIGASTGIFSVLKAVLLRSLPFSNSGPSSPVRYGKPLGRQPGPVCCSS